MTEDIKKPTKNKHEVGTALDFNRMYRSFDDGRTVSTEDRPSSRDLELMIVRDAQAQQLARALKLPIRAADYDIVGTKGDKGERDFVEYVLNAPRLQGGMTTPFRTVLGQMANAVVTRQAFFEKVWKLQDTGEYKGKYTLHKLGFRPPATCEMRTDKNGSFNGFFHEAWKGQNFREVTFTPKKAYVYVHNSDEHPIIGGTPFDTVYRVYQNKLKISFFYYAFLENIAFPKTLVRAAGDDPEALQYLIDKAKKFGTMGIMGLYDEENIEPYEARRNTRDYQNALEYLDWQMAKACMAQFLDLGTSGERGSYALSKDKSAFFLNSLEATLNEIAMHVNNYLIADLVRYNFGADAAYPTIRFRPLADESAEAVMELYRHITMAQAPNVTAPFMLKLMQRVSEIVGLDLDPLKDFDEEALQAVQETIPTAREEMESKESRAGAGQNAVTGKDRNANNKTPQDQEPGRVGSKRNDNTSITNQQRAPRTPRRRNDLSEHIDNLVDMGFSKEEIENYLALDGDVE